MTQNRFAVFDIDGTLIRWQLYHAVVNRLAKAGALGPHAEKRLKRALMAWKHRENPNAFKQYEKLLVDLHEEGLRNTSTELFDKLVTEIIEEYKDQSYVYTRNLVKELKAKGYKLFIISGSHAELIEQIANYYGFDDWLGCHYERKDSAFTGKVQVSTLDKAKSLQVLLDRNNVTLSGSIGIGDSNSDAAMLKMVEHPITFNPDQKLFQTAQENGWKIVIERKNVIYELTVTKNGYMLK